MDKLVGYESEENDSDGNLNENKVNSQQGEPASGSKTSASLAEEWESFEKMIGETALKPAKPSPDVDIQSIPLPIPQPSIPLTEHPTESPLMNIFPPPTEVSDSDDDDVIAIGTEPRRALSVSSKDSRSSRSCKSSKSRSSSASSSSYRSSSSSSDRSDDSKKKKKIRKRKGSVLQEKHKPERKRSSSRSPSPGHDSEQEIKKSTVDHALSEPRPEIVQLVRRQSKQSEDKPSVSRSRSRSADRRSKSPEKSKSPKRSSRSPKRSRSFRRSRSRKRSKTSRSRSRDRRSRSRSRHRRKRSRDRKDSKSDNGHASGRRRSRSRSRTRRRKSKSRERRRSRDRSRSRDRRRRSRSRSPSRRHRDRGRRDRKRNRPHERRRSRSRSGGRRRRSRDRKRSNRRSKSRTPPKKGRQITFKEMMKQQLKAAAEGKIQLSTEDIKALMSSEKPSSLPLNSSNPLLAMAAGADGKVTPQQALLQTMAAMHQKAQQLTGVAVPKYYNPAAVNPLKYAEQVQKRKLLWSKTKDHKEETEAQWGGTSFAQDQDGRVAAKFRKLMGMKDDEQAPTEDELAEEQRRKQEELFSRLDKEYESARIATHTHRGVGFGFQSGMSGYQFQQNRTEKK